MITVKVPATTANLGPGYDVFGMALSMYSTFSAEFCEDGWHCQVKGLEKEKLADKEDLVTHSMKHVFQMMNFDVSGVNIIIVNGIPMCRGLGSSAAAIIGGVMLANGLMGFPLSEEQVLHFANEIEGHPDNVTPALVGQMTMSVTTENGVLYRQILPFEGLSTVVFIPEYEVSTEKSRGVLPKSITMDDAVFNLSRASLLVYAMMNGDGELIRYAMADCLHEPYRQALIKGFDEFKAVAFDHHAFGFALSGSGSTIIAFCHEDHASSIADGFDTKAKALGIWGESKILEPSITGASYV